MSEGSVVLSINAQDWAAQLARALCSPYINVESKNFADTESYFTLDRTAQLEGKRVFICARLLSATSSYSCNDQLMRILFCAAACKKLGAAELILLLPYLPYARQELAHEAGLPGNGELLRDLFGGVGVSLVITADIHQRTTLQADEGFVRHILLDEFWEGIVKDEFFTRTEPQSLVLVAPDQGAFFRVHELAARCKLPVVSIAKQRVGVNKVQALHLNADVQGKHAIIVDDILDTGGTAASACRLLKECGAYSVSGFFTHAVCSRVFEENLQKGQIERLIVTDTVQPAGQLPVFIQSRGLAGYFINRVLGIMQSQSRQEAELT